MKLQVHCCFGDVVRELTVPCGDGRKSVKWLALVAAQRFVIDVAARGRSRQREVSCSTVAAGTQLVPSGVSTSEESTFYHPSALLCDVFEEAEVVYVKLEPKMRVGAAGQPRRSRWATIAFCASRPDERSQALEEEYSAMVEAKKLAREQEKAAKAKTAKVQAGKMRLLIEHQLMSPELLHQAMDNEWQRLVERRAIERFARTQKEEQMIFQILEKNFPLLMELFKFYCAQSGSVGSVHEMEFVEFATMVREMDLNDDLDHNRIIVAFSECAVVKETLTGEKQVVQGKGVSTNGYLELSGFFAALLWLAHFSKQGKKLYGPAASTTEALQRLLDENVDASLQLNRSSLIGTVTRNALGTDEVLATFHLHHKQLLDVFKTYLHDDLEDDDDDDNDSIHQHRHAVNFDFRAGCMHMSEYLLILEDARLIGKTVSAHDELTMKECRQAFSGALVDHSINGIVVLPPERMDRLSAYSTSSSTQKQARLGDQPVAPAAADPFLLSYAEFLEALLRVSLLKWDDETYTLEQKLEMALMAIIENAHASHKDKKNKNKQPQGRARRASVGVKTFRASFEMQ